MRKFLIPLVLIMFLIPSFAGAANLTMDDGTVINLDSLTDSEKTNIIKYMDKINEAKKTTIGSTVTDEILESAKDPAKLNQWRVLITGTIRDVANDLNITVNEFVKTPVGAGVAALIFYKVAGKDIFSKFMGIILAIPFWFAVCIACGLVARYFLGHKTEYTEVKKTPKYIQNQDTKNAVEEHMPDAESVTIRIPQRICRYDWNSNDARNVLGVFLLGIPIIVTIACFIVVFIA